MALYSGPKASLTILATFGITVLLLAQLTTAAPVHDQETTELDTYDEDATGCYYNFQHYNEGDRIITNEPCLNCTCHNRMLMCYLRVCPFTKAIGSDCKIEKRADQCCPVISCPEVPVQLLTSTTTIPSTDSTEVGHLDNFGCTIDGLFYTNGAKVPSDAHKPCELCYCIRNRTACVMQECTLNVEGCKPVYQDGVCCPVKYNCDQEETLLLETTVRPTPGLILTTTLAPGVPLDCKHNGELYSDGELIHTKNPCEHCYCMRSEIVCVVQDCGTPLEKIDNNCVALPPRHGQCCPDVYECDNTTIAIKDIQQPVTKEPSRDSEVDQTPVPSSEDDNIVPIKETTKEQDTQQVTQEPVVLEDDIKTHIDDHEAPSEPSEIEQEDQSVHKDTETSDSITVEPLDTFSDVPEQVTEKVSLSEPHKGEHVSGQPTSTVKQPIEHETTEKVVEPVIQDDHIPGHIGEHEHEISEEPHPLPEEEKDQEPLPDDHKIISDHTSSSDENDLVTEKSGLEYEKYTEKIMEIETTTKTIHIMEESVSTEKLEIHDQVIGDITEAPHVHVKDEVQEHEKPHVDDSNVQTPDYEKTTLKSIPEADSTTFEPKLSYTTPSYIKKDDEKKPEQGEPSTSAPVVETSDISLHLDDQRPTSSDEEKIHDDSESSEHSLVDKSTEGSIPVEKDDSISPTEDIKQFQTTTLSENTTPVPAILHEDTDAHENVIDEQHTSQRPTVADSHDHVTYPVEAVDSDADTETHKPVFEDHVDVSTESVLSDHKPSHTEHPIYTESPFVKDELEHETEHKVTGTIVDQSTTDKTIENEVISQESSTHHYLDDSTQDDKHFVSVEQFSSTTVKSDEDLQNEIVKDISNIINEVSHGVSTRKPEWVQSSEKVSESPAYDEHVTEQISIDQNKIPDNGHTDESIQKPIRDDNIVHPESTEIPIYTQKPKEDETKIHDKIEDDKDHVTQHPDAAHINQEHIHGDHEYSTVEPDVHSVTDEVKIHDTHGPEEHSTHKADEEHSTQTSEISNEKEVEHTDIKVPEVLVEEYTTIPTSQTTHIEISHIGTEEHPTDKPDLKPIIDDTEEQSIHTSEIVPTHDEDKPVSPDQTQENYSPEPVITVTEQDDNIVVDHEDVTEHSHKPVTLVDVEEDINEIHKETEHEPSQRPESTVVYDDKTKHTTPKEDAISVTERETITAKYHETVDTTSYRPHEEVTISYEVEKDSDHKPELEIPHKDVKPISSQVTEPSKLADEESTSQHEITEHASFKPEIKPTDEAEEHAHHAHEDDSDVSTTTVVFDEKDIIHEDAEPHSTHRPAIVQPELTTKSTLNIHDEPHATVTESHEYVEEHTQEAVESDEDVVPQHIPGEGDCLVEDKTYKNNSDVPTMNHCQVSCRCVSSIVECLMVGCTPPPSNMLNCMPIYHGADRCCPTYACEGAESDVPESDSQMIDKHHSTARPESSTSIHEVEKDTENYITPVEEQKVHELESSTHIIEPTQDIEDHTLAVPVETHPASELSQEPVLIGEESDVDHKDKVESHEHTMIPQEYTTHKYAGVFSSETPLDKVTEHDLESVHAVTETVSVIVESSPETEESSSVHTETEKVEFSSENPFDTQDHVVVKVTTAHPEQDTKDHEEHVFEDTTEIDQQTVDHKDVTEQAHITDITSVPHKYSTTTSQPLLEKQTEANKDHPDLSHLHPTTEHIDSTHHVHHTTESHTETDTKIGDSTTKIPEISDVEHTEVTYSKPTEQAIVEEVEDFTIKTYLDESETASEQSALDKDTVHTPTTQKSEILMDIDHTKTPETQQEFTTQQQEAETSKDESGKPEHEELVPPVSSEQQPTEHPEEEPHKLPEHIQHTTQKSVVESDHSEQENELAGDLGEDTHKGTQEHVITQVEKETTVKSDEAIITTISPDQFESSSEPEKHVTREPLHEDEYIEGSGMIHHIGTDTYTTSKSEISHEEHEPVTTEIYEVLSGDHELHTTIKSDVLHEDHEPQTTTKYEVLHEDHEPQTTTKSEVLHEDHEPQTTTESEMLHEEHEPQTTTKSEVLHEPQTTIKSEVLHEEHEPQTTTKSEVLHEEHEPHTTTKSEVLHEHELQTTTKYEVLHEEHESSHTTAGPEIMSEDHELHTTTKSEVLHEDHESHMTDKPEIFHEVYEPSSTPEILHEDHEPHTTTKSEVLHEEHTTAHTTVTPEIIHEEHRPHTTTTFEVLYEDHDQQTTIKSVVLHEDHEPHTTTKTEILHEVQEPYTTTKSDVPHEEPHTTTKSEISEHESHTSVQPEVLHEDHESHMTTHSDISHDELHTTTKHEILHEEHEPFTTAQPDILHEEHKPHTTTQSDVSYEEKEPHTTSKSDVSHEENYTTTKSDISHEEPHTTTKSEILEHESHTTQHEVLHEEHESHTTKKPYISHEEHESHTTIKSAVSHEEPELQTTVKYEVLHEEHEPQTTSKPEDLHQEHFTQEPIIADDTEEHTSDKQETTVKDYKPSSETPVVLESQTHKHEEEHTSTTHPVDEVSSEKVTTVKPEIGDHVVSSTHKSYESGLEQEKENEIVPTEAYPTDLEYVDKDHIKPSDDTHEHHTTPSNINIVQTEEPESHHDEHVPETHTSTIEDTSEIYVEHDPIIEGYTTGKIDASDSDNKYITEASILEDEHKTEVSVTVSDTETQTDKNIVLDHKEHTTLSSLGETISVEENLAEENEIGQDNQEPVKIEHKDKYPDQSDIKVTTEGTKEHPITVHEKEPVVDEDDSSHEISTGGPTEGPVSSDSPVYLAPAKNVTEAVISEDHTTESILTVTSKDKLETSPEHHTDELHLVTSPKYPSQHTDENILSHDISSHAPDFEVSSEHSSISDEHILHEHSTSSPTTEKSSETSSEEQTHPSKPDSSEHVYPVDEEFGHIPSESPEVSHQEHEDGEDYDEDDQTAFGPGTCRYGGKVYVSAQQIPRDDPCDFCFCFRSDIICLQQSCPPPIPGCHEEPIHGFCCPRYECPVSMATVLNMTTTTTTTTTTLPPHFLSHAYKGAAVRRGCQIQGKAYQVGEYIKSASGPCLSCTCGGDGQMKCDPKVCSPEPMIQQMIAAAAASRRR